MKHTTHTLFYFILLVLTFSYSANAQTELWSMTSDGGQYGTGTVFHIKPDGGGYTVNYDFPDTIINGASPVYSTPLYVNGKFYSMTSAGGVYHKGIIFVNDTNAGTYTSLYSFGGTDGSTPYGSLMLANDGNLYGMTSLGGTNNFGVIFRYNPVTNVYTKLFDFSSSSGREPNGGLIQATNGLLYGMTRLGGTSNDGIIFSYDISTSTFTRLHNFSGTAGRSPYANLIQAANGKLYGVTQSGGINSVGNIFSYDIGTNAYLSRFDFGNGSTGKFPYGSLIQLPSGLLYGTATVGGTSTGGVIFSFDDATLSYNVIHNFFPAIGTDGSTPYCTLLLASDGKLYGTASAGSGSAGIIFSCITGGTFTRLSAFSFTATGSTPKGSLVQAVPGGKLFGMTNVGGVGQGTYFNFNITGSVLTKQLDFNFKPKGTFPSASFCKGADGKLYGLTTSGGSNGEGVLFSFVPSTNTYAKLSDLYANAGPTGNVMQASNGILYGLTNGGGSNGQGALFSYNLSTSTFATLVNLNSGAGGRIPQGSLIQASNGLLYGMTGYGGASDFGTIFSYNISTSTYTKLMEFTGAANGKRPYGSLVQASNGKLYGMTSAGGTADDGVVFSYDPATSVYGKIVDFTGTTNGSIPFGSLIQATNGLLYGMTETGGTNSGGVIFSLDPSTNAFVKVYDFPVFTAAGAIGGMGTRGTLFQGADSKLYGMTFEGGTNNEGAIFSFNITTSTYTLLRDLNFPDGIKPYYGSFVEVGISLLTGSVPATICAGNALNVNYTVSSSLTVGNVFTAQLSNSSGSFASPTIIGTLSTTSSGTIACIIPSGTATGSGYRIRVVASSPALTGSDNGSNISITPSTNTFYADADMDTYGNPSASHAACTAPPGYVLNNTDCNDGSASVHPGAIEIVGNGIDEDCNGQELCYTDVDNDNYGTNATIVSANLVCTDFNEAPVNGDCNDNNSSIHPTATEVVGDGVDQDCNGGELCYTDVDNDNFGTNVTIASANLVCTDFNEASINGDCNDNNSAINPSATEIVGDGVDEDCNGQELCYTDVDNDNYGTNVTIASTNLVCTDFNEAPVNGDCNDNAASINPGATEVVGDGVDQNCNGQELCYTDMDDDNFGTNVTIASANLVCTDLNEAALNGDCNDNNASIHPGATEITGDGVDQDCNTQEICFVDVDNDNYGTSVMLASANLSCADLNEAPVSGDCNDNNAAINPGATEQCCNFTDENCNSQVNENCPLQAGVYCIGPATSYSPPSGPAYLNGNNPYDHITDAVNYLNAHGTCGNVIFELQNDFTSTGETFPITITYSGTPTSTATFRPRADISSNVSINCTVLAANMIVFDDADYVTFDGSPGGVMDSICKINVTNNSPSVNAGTNFLFRNNTTHCTINALNIDGGSGADYCIQIGDATSTNGNSFLTINNCYIGCVNISQPADTAIRSRDGNSGSITNSDITITNNKIHDILDGVVVLYASSSGNWNISFNHFYVTTTKALQISEPVIYLSNGPTTATIRGNYIGGMAPYAGSSMMNDDSGLGIIGIDVDIKNSTSLSTVRDNTIKNIQRDGSNPSSFVGILVQEGPVSVFGNILGMQGAGGGLFFNSPTSFNGIIYSSTQSSLLCVVNDNKLANIILVNTLSGNNHFIGINFENITASLIQSVGANSISDVDYYGDGIFTGLLIKGSLNVSPSAVLVFDNKLETVRCWNASGCVFTGIHSEQGNITLSGNRIGKYNVAADTWATSNNTHFGIRCTQNGSAFLQEDTVCGMTIGTAGIAKFTAIDVILPGNYSATLSYNVIKDIRTSSIKPSIEFDPNADFTLTGIFLSAGGISQVSNNTVSDLYAMATSVSNPVVTGISILSSNTTNVYGNSVIGFMNLATGTSPFPGIIGVYVSSTGQCNIFDNMISCNNNGNTNGVNIFGIYDMSNNGIRSHHFNSIQIAGSSSSAANSAAFTLRSNTSLMDIKNNIFSNLRTGGGKNYAIVNYTGSTVSWPAGTSNYNDLYSQNSSTLGAWPSGSDKTFANWKTISAGDANSNNVGPSFISTFDLHLTPTGNCAMNGTGTPGIASFDYDNQIRNATAPDIGADEFSGDQFPGAAGTITGTSPVCKGQNGVAYSIAAVANATGYNWTLPFGASIATGTNTNSITVNFSASASSGNIIVTPTNVCGSGTSSSPFAVTVNTCSLTFNLKLFLEGFYTGGGFMNNAGLGGCLYKLGATGDSTVVDTVVVSLMHPISLALVETKKVILKTNGSVIVSFSNAITAGSSYYIKINHRNTIETWSNAPVVITNGGLYDFTTNASKAYGNNMSQVFDMLKFAFYSGDISDANSATVGLQDRIIESQDYSDMENAISVTLLGYKFEDITGDNVVESEDYSLMETNVYYTIVTMRP